MDGYNFVPLASDDYVEQYVIACSAVTMMWRSPRRPDDSQLSSKVGEDEKRNVYMLVPKRESSIWLNSRMRIMSFGPL